MATTIDELQVLISANAEAFQREMKSVKSQLGILGDSAKGAEKSFTSSFGGMAAKLALLGGAMIGVGKIIGGSVKEFGSLEQNLGGAEAVFGEFADGIKQKAKDSAQTMGTSMSQYLASANKMGSLFQGAGYSARDSMAMTADSMQRAADVASVMGLSQEAALESIAGMAKGNFTMMDNLGVAMNDTALKAYMLEQGIAGNIEKMSTAEKVGIAYQMFMDRTSKYAGNFAREATTLEGSLAIMRAELANVGAQLGQAFAPMVAAAANFVSNVLAPAIGAVIPYIVALGQIIQQVASQVFGFIGGIFGVKKAVGGATGATAQAGKSMKSLGAQAGGAGGGMGKAAGGAKKLKKELLGLAKFDEMNVLKTPDDPSAGGGGGGAGGGGAPAIEIPEMNFGKFNSGFDEVSAKAKKIADEIRAYFSNLFDFKKIGAAFARFWDDIKKGASPVFKVIADIWKSYLEPFVKWAGNSFLPAFLNAVGGAINLVGNVIGATWKYLKPFIDAFLKPIAEFTGGVIVTVLNAIGDGMRAISANAGLVDFFGGLLAVITATTAAFQAYQLIMGVVTGAKLALSGVMVAGTAASGAYAAGIAAVSMAQNLAATASSAFSGVISTMLNPAFLAIAAAVTAALLVVEQWKLEAAEQALAEQQRIDTIKSAEQAEKWRTEAVNGSAQAIRDLKTAELEAVDAELAAINSKQRAEKAQRDYEAALRSGTYSAEELRKKELEALQAKGQAEAANKKLKESQDKVKGAVEEHINQKWKEMAAERQSDLSKLQQAGKYEELRAKLQELATSELKYTDAHGRNATMSKQDTKAMADFIGDQLARVNDGNGKAWKGIWEAAQHNTDKLREVSPKVFEAAKGSGKNFGDGVVVGIAGQNGAVYQAGWNQGKQGQKGFNDALRIRSPSRVMRDQAEFFGDGVIWGIENSGAGVIRSVTSLANNMAENFAPEFRNINLPEVPDLDTSNSVMSGTIVGNFGYKIETSLAENIAQSIRNQPINLTVNVGDEKMLEKLIGGINDRSFITGGSVIDL